MTITSNLKLEGRGNKLLGLILFRILTITVLLGSSTIINLQSDAVWSPVQHIIFYSIGFSYLLSIFYLLAVKYNANYRFQAVAQITADAFFWSCLIYLTDGLHSPFTFLYTLSIIHGSILLGKRGAYYMFALSTLCFLVVVWMEGHTIFHEGLQLVRSYDSMLELSTLYLFFLNFCMFLLIAILASNLAEQVESQEEILSHQLISLDMQRMLNRSIVSGMSSGFVMIDLAGLVTFFNVAAERMADVSFEEIRDQPLVDIFPHLSEAVDKELSGEPWQRYKEFTLPAANGSSQRHLVASFSDLLGINNQRTGSILMLEDITQRRKLEEKLNLNEKLAAVGKLAAGIAHEIRNPLASISGSIQILRRELPGGDDNEKLTEIVVRETDRLNNLITDFLAYARPNPMTLSLVNVREILEDITQLLEADSEYATVRVRVEYDEELPDLVAGAEQVRQIIWNILKNAVHAVKRMPKGVVWIAVRREELGNETPIPAICFEIKDNGEGMDREAQEHIFDPFYTTKAKGTGLGMSIVYQAVKVHSGTIWVESELGAGTTFQIMLPLRSKEDIGTTIGKE